MTNESNRRRLAAAVRDRRKALKLTQGQVQANGGPSTATLRQIEGAREIDFRAGTIDPLERILKWAEGSVQAVLDGGEPTTVDEDPSESAREMSTPDPEADAAPPASSASDHPDALFRTWYEAWARGQNVALHYAQVRGLRFENAKQELEDLLQMLHAANQGLRVWTPPWDPGIEFTAEDRPWSEEWWWEVDDRARPPYDPEGVNRIPSPPWFSWANGTAVLRDGRLIDASTSETTPATDPQDARTDGDSGTSTTGAAGRGDTDAESREPIIFDQVKAAAARKAATANREDQGSGLATSDGYRAEAARKGKTQRRQELEAFGEPGEESQDDGLGRDD